MNLFEIAAQVPKPAEMATAEAELLAAQARWHGRADDYNVVLRRLQVAERGEGGEKAEPLRGELAAVQAALNGLQQQQSAARTVIAAHMPTYLAALHAALLPVRKSMAKRVVAAINELKLATDVLAESWNLIGAAGGSPTRVPLPIHADAVRKLADKIVSEEAA